MSNLKSAILSFVFVLGITTFANATTDNSTSSQNELRTELTKILDKMDLGAYEISEAKINVTFMVNSDNEVVVLSTDNKNLDQLIKGKLNYKKLNSYEGPVNKTYIIPVKIQA